MSCDRAWELNYETRYWRNDRRKDKSDGKTRKKGAGSYWITLRTRYDTVN